MDTSYGSSLVWVCLACGQLAPYQASPLDLIDSANAIDLTFAAPSSPTVVASSLVHQSSAFPMTDEDVFRSPGVLTRDAPQYYTDDARCSRSAKQNGLDNRSNASTKGNDSGGDDDTNHYRAESRFSTTSPCDHHHHCETVAHSHRSHSGEDRHLCLNNESHSYLTMASLSHHQRSQKKQRQRSDSVGNDTTGTTEPDAHQQRQGASPGHRSLLATSPLAHESRRDQSSAHRRPPSFPLHDSNSRVNITVPEPMQSLAALLMEEHLVGSREMRFCENCHEVRCAEIRQAFEVVPKPIVDLSGVGADPCRRTVVNSHWARNSSTGRGAWAYSRHSYPLQQSTECPEALSYRSSGSKVNDNCTDPENSAPFPGTSYRRSDEDTVSHRPAVSSFLYACRLSSGTRNDAYKKHTPSRESERSSSPPTSQHGDYYHSPSPKNARSASSGRSPFFSASRDTSQRKREITSVHYVVARSVARMLVKLKSAAVTMMHSFHPLSPSLPTARARNHNSDEDGDGNSDHIGGGQPHVSSALSQQLSPTSTPGTTSSSYESAIKHCPEHFLSSLNSSLSETGAMVGCAESNGTSYNSTGTTTTSQHLQQQHLQQQQQTRRQYSQRQQSWLIEDFDSQAEEEYSTRDRHLFSNYLPDHASVYAQPRLPPKGTDVALDFSSTLTNNTICAVDATVLRVSKEKWNSISVPEALWRLVLPSFGPPFLGNLQTVGPSSSCGGSCQSTPQRGANSSVDGLSKPYRGFRGEVEDAVRKLDSMQLEVAKLRLEQILAEVNAEQVHPEKSADP